MPKSKSRSRSETKSKSKSKYDKYFRISKYDKPVKIFPNLLEYHYEAKKMYTKYFCKNCMRLLDVGGGPIKSHFHNWLKLGIKEVYVIDPSSDYYKRNLETIDKYKSTYSDFNVQVIKGVGEKDWNSGKAGMNNDSRDLLKTMKDKTFGCITFEFSFHYMIGNMKQLMKNIETHTHSGSVVIIYIMDGTFLFNHFQNNNTDQYSVRNNHGEIVFEVTKKYKSESNNNPKKLKVDVYFKNVAGLNNTISEYLVPNDFIVEHFKKSGFLLTNKNKLPNIDRQNSRNLLDFERQISNLYNVYVFTKI